MHDSRAGWRWEKLKHKVKDVGAVVMYDLRASGSGSKVKCKLKYTRAVVMYDSRTGWRWDVKVKK